MKSQKELYVLWWNDNDRDFQGYRLYYNPEDAIVVGLACDHCYTVGFVPSDDKQHRKTYTLEWDDASAGDSITGRLITTYAPIKAKATSNGIGVDGLRVKTFVNTDDFDKWIDQVQAVGMEKYQIGMEKAQDKLERAQDKLERAQDKLEKALSKSQSKSSSFSSSTSSSSSSSSTILDDNGNQVVSGIVIDTDGEPLIGATVQPIGGGNVAVTDFNGRFMLILPNYVKQLKVSYVGYITQELPVQPNMAITMSGDELIGNNDLSDLFLRKKESNQSGKDDSNSWMKKLLFYVGKIQQSGNRYIYLSKLYDLCKDTDGLDQTDLKIAMQQLGSVYKQLKDKKKLKENELLFLENMVDLLETKVNSIHNWNLD